MLKPKKITEKTYRTCQHCKIVTDKFLDYKKEPLMGRCDFYQHLFLLTEKINCSNYGQ